LHSHEEHQQIEVLVVGDDRELERRIDAALHSVPHRITRWLRLPLVFSSGPTPGETSGLDVVDPDLAIVEEAGHGELPQRLAALKTRFPRCQVLLIGEPDSALTPRDLAPGLVRHWFVRPVVPEAIERTLLAAGRTLARARRDQQRHERSLTGFEAILGEDPALGEVLRAAQKAAASPSTTVLVLGETGTGKGLLARALHGASPRRDGPFIDVNCGAIPAPLLEAELFGHVRGAFTGAVREKEGLLELADSGTVFLDEIGELDLLLQSKLLKFLDDGMIRRVQGTTQVRVDVRVLAATNQDLDAAVKAGSFRLDLYHRLNVVSLRLPSLRERPQDIRLLAVHYLDQLGRRLGRRDLRWSEEALRALAQYSWPGNVRELINLTERLVLLAEGDRPLRVEDLPPAMQTRAPLVQFRSAGDPPVIHLPPEGIPLEQVERAFLVEALAAASGNVTRAAALLHLGRGGLRYRLEKYNLGSLASGRRGRPMGRSRPKAA